MNTYAAHLIDVAHAAYRAGRHAEAEATLRLALGQGTRDPWIVYFIGHLCYLQGRLEEARQYLAHSLQLDPDNARAHNDLGETLCGLGRQAEAVPHFERSIALEPTLAHGYGNLAAALVALNKPEAALQWAQKSLWHATDKTVAHCDLGSVLGRLGRQKEALRQYELALAIKPDNAHAHYYASLMRLSLGELPAAWEMHEARLLIPQGIGGRRQHPQRRWRGESDIAGRRILLHAEQGLGDTIMFARYAAMVAELGATVYLEVQTGMRAALHGLARVAAIYEFGEHLPEFDLHCPLMSLPWIFQTRLDTIPNTTPYLTPRPERAAVWERRFGQWRNMRVGLAWSGRATHASDLTRSVPLSLLTPLLTRGDIDVHVVQPEIRPDDRAVLNALPNVADHSSQLTDFAETAALMTQMDLIVSVDTAAAHLAGALGRPSWLLLAYSADWRWMRERGDTPWYPSTRLFRQTKRDDWQSVLDTLTRQLDQWTQRQ